MAQVAKECNARAGMDSGTPAAANACSTSRPCTSLNSVLRASITPAGSSPSDVCTCRRERSVGVDVHHGAAVADAAARIVTSFSRFCGTCGDEDQQDSLAPGARSETHLLELCGSRTARKPAVLSGAERAPQALRAFRGQQALSRKGHIEKALQSVLRAVSASRQTTSSERFAAFPVAERAPQTLRPFRGQECSLLPETRIRRPLARPLGRVCLKTDVLSEKPCSVPSLGETRRPTSPENLAVFLVSLRSEGVSGCKSMAESNSNRTKI